MNAFGNIIWLIFGGLIVFIEYLVFSFLLIITIIGIPFGIQTLKLASLSLWPFGRHSVVHERAGGCLHILFNIVWIFTGGLSICITHLLFGALLCITIIGIPFGMQHFKLAGTALTPFGRDIVYTDKVRV